MQGSERGAVQLGKPEFNVLKTVCLNVMVGEPSLWFLSRDYVGEIHLGNKNNVEIQHMHFFSTAWESLFYVCGFLANNKTLTDLQRES